MGPKALLKNERKATEKTSSAWTRKLNLQTKKTAVLWNTVHLHQIEDKAEAVKQERPGSRHVEKTANEDSAVEVRSQKDSLILQKLKNGKLRKQEEDAGQWLLGFSKMWTFMISYFN